MLKFNRLFFVLAISLTLAAAHFAQTPDAKALFEQGVRQMQERRFAEALDAFQRSARLDATQPATHGNIGAALVALNRVAESIAPLREAVRLAGSDPLFRLSLCRSLSLTRNHAEAVPQCEEAVRLGGAAEAHVGLIAALRTAKRTNEAAQRAEAALQRFPDHEELRFAAAETFFAEGNFSRSLELFEALARLRPNLAGYQAALAENYLRLERDAEAIAAARRAIELEPRHPLAHFFLGRVFFELGQHEEAAANFRRAAEIDAGMAETFYFLGVAESRRGRLELAIPALREAARLEPGSFVYNGELGKALKEDKRYEEATEFLLKADRLDPRDFETKVGLGLALMSLARFNEALDYFGQADRLKPGHPVIQMFLNVARARQQNAARMDEMKQYVLDNPKNVEARTQWAEMLVYLRRTKEALAAIDELIPLLPPTNKNLTLVGVLYTDLGMDEKADEYHRKALAVEPHYVIYMSLAANLMKLGRTDEAQQAYRSAVELKPDAPALLKVYADFLRDHGKRAEALEFYKRAVALEPTNSPALFNLGVLSKLAGNQDAARQYYEQLRAVDPLQARVLNRFLRLR